MSEAGLDLLTVVVGFLGAVLLVGPSGCPFAVSWLPFPRELCLAAVGFFLLYIVFCL